MSLRGTLYLAEDQSLFLLPRIGGSKPLPSPALEELMFYFGLSGSLNSCAHKPILTYIHVHN